MDNGFRVTAAQLRDHATAVGDVATRVAAAAEAGHQVAGMDDAYGLICWPIGRMLAGPQDRCVDALDKATQALSRIANDLDSTTETYARIDSTAATRLRKISNRLRTSSAPTRAFVL